MVQICIKGDNLIIKLKGFEKVVALKGSLKIPFNCVGRVAYVKDLDDTEKEQIYPKMRLGGLSIGEILYGGFTTSLGLAFFATKKLERSIVIYIKCSFPYKIVVIEVSDSETLSELEKKLKNSDSSD
ncbi:hypothetical protein [Sulfuracidifex metallicus]|uniref:Bacterial Pleckstrin homology domain-containing protein n=1 Tax=Sulfuracidifex metallicus DSM 6482 = JCM 9184 TaxID=523847 RepID=A0A6A9QSF7_SULME|nr:hypothetical protein [Sulfuracidifex metallicus]MUN28082.1 hypothetical protein [Sulfuracidifex metallicus DSM 6482 = JCM 9184]WOE51374.1 hypothetical protein RQ359_000657 [Sulfuracidifex metallicus DSM 6482 = JCM 9184]